MGKRANNPHNDYLIDLIRSAVLGEPVPVIPDNCTPDDLGNLIRQQQLTNLVYPTVLQAPSLKPLQLQLERDYLIQIPKVTNQELEIQKWLDAADAKGINCIPLKGFLLRKLYPTPLSRSMTDLDVLIRDMDRPDIRIWMESLGYIAEETHELSHHDNFKKHPWMYMELHFHLMKPRPGRDELEKKVWERATLIPGRQHIYQMSMDDFYIFHLLHLHKHFITRGVGLKGVIDIHFFLNAHGADLNRTYLRQELEALGIFDFAAYMEKLSQILLGSEPADPDSKLVADYMADCGSFGSSQQHRAMEMAKTKGSSTSSKKLRYLLRRLFPGVSHMQRLFPSVKRFPWLLPAYWVARLFKIVFKRESGHILSELNNEQFDAAGQVLAITGAHRS